jgi:hypothetical protein
MDSVQSDDPIFSPLLKNRTDAGLGKDFVIHDEETKEKYMEWDKLKRIYFEAKLEHEKKKALEKYLII